MSEINPGIWDGLSPDKAQALYPDEWERFMRDPYGFRAPRAESYHDLCSECTISMFEFRSVVPVRSRIRGISPD